MEHSKDLFLQEFRRLTTDRLKNFWGYGSFEAPTWFVGMEEGLGDIKEELIVARFRATDGKEVVDIRQGMRAVADHIRWFQPKARIQATWKYLIAVHLYFKNGVKPNKEEIREYQISRLGDSLLKETSIFELMPLPSTGVNEESWRYGNLGILELSTRAEYLKTYKHHRVLRLRELLHQNRPKLVILFSLTYLADWKAVIGAEPEEISNGMYFAPSGATAFCIVPHSTSRGMSYKRVYEFVDKVRDRIDLS